MCSGALVEMQYLNFGIARFTGRRQLLQILLPVMVLPFRQIAQVAPAVEPRVVAVVEGDLHRVVSNGFNAAMATEDFPVCRTSCPGP